MEESYRFLLNEINGYNKTVVAGISGGPDSMTLLHLLLRLKKEISINVICAHVNHNVRGESEQEAKDLEDFCKKHHIQFEHIKIEEYGDDNFENEARVKRYTFFEELIKKYDAPYLVTGHHGDDLIETILMRLTRGSTFRGYAGFSRVVDRGAYKILRPLITVTKDDILKYNCTYNLKYATDLSNLSNKYTRNRYRKYVLPFLKNEDSKVHEKFLKFSETILQYNEYMDNEMKKMMNGVYSQKVLNIELFNELDKVMQDRIINYIMETIYHDDLMLISDVHTSLIFKLINSPKPNAYIYLPENIRVIKSYQTLTFTKEKTKAEDYEIELISYVNIPNGKNLEIVDQSADNSNFTCRLSSKEITMPLYVRNKKDGDRMEVKGLLGRKKIKDIFIDEKIDARERDIWPILVDREGKIIWLPGLKKSKYDKSKNESYDIIIRYH
jgi:tRNA(Ile)-lysidine synthetase-like protein